VDKTVSKSLTLSDIKSLIPHRYENILVDQFDFRESEEEIKGELSLRISENDPLDRTLFFKEKKAGEKVLLTPFLMEVMALGAILCAGSVPEGKLVFFVSISNFKKHKDVLLDSQLLGSLSPLRGKAEFIRYAGNLYTSNKEPISEGELMAYILDLSNETDDVVKKKTDIPEAGFNFVVDKNEALKSKHMYVIDALVAYSDEEKTAVSTYTFPLDHPLIKGHFPDKPVLMGVMQWMGIQDAFLGLGLYLKEKTGKSGTYTMTADAQLLKADGTLVADAKKVLVEATMGQDNSPDQTDIIETKKLVFRDTVSPGDKLFIKLFNLVID
jgi:3-hydroxymyristoyl/3-hydroxydecanoyl-(acyl carrier protein) dehydratase